MPNGDIVSAGSDNAIRVWSTSSERQADGDVLAVGSRCGRCPAVDLISAPITLSGIRKGDCQSDLSVSAYDDGQVAELM
jgi:hypothetical protein